MILVSRARQKRDLAEVTLLFDGKAREIQVYTATASMIGNPAKVPASDLISPTPSPSVPDHFPF